MLTNNRWSIVQLTQTEGCSVHRMLALAAALALLLTASVAAAQAPAQAAAAATPSIDDVIKAVRADLQGARADIMAKNLSLSGDQAAKFWPLFNEYQKEQNVIIEAQMKDLSSYAQNYATLDDKATLGLMNAHFTRDASMNALRQKWLGEFQKVVLRRTSYTDAPTSVRPRPVSALSLSRRSSARPAPRRAPLRHDRRD